MGHQPSIQDKLQQLIQVLNEGLIERDEEVKLALLALIAKENLLLIGPPGTAKSEISRRFAKVIKDANYFEYLLTKFTAPEEVFGPLSISKLKNDEFSRKTEGYMPSSNVVFLDEVFKANSAILNSLLTIMNERIYHNGAVKQQTPLTSLISASNELPIGNSELEALYDRFLIRKFVNYVSDDNIERLINLAPKPFDVPVHLQLTVDEIESISQAAKQVTIENDIISIIKRIRKQFNDEFKDNSDEQLSDRRLVKIVKVLRVSAYTNGRSEVNYSDLVLLKHCLCNNFENYKKVNKIINENINMEV
ncbi:AAA family ATPase [Moritella sp. 24]|uniref:AAA family ATPase n=1 Tax=Moritella sp. 24 TaxID=2746230 RepID=UPI001BA5F347|nr:AAA family ATPase [Moritella sp. 24]QUM76720.1 AAA family ATPase [Moritella sp. 24]